MDIYLGPQPNSLVWSVRNGTWLDHKGYDNINWLEKYVPMAKRQNIKPVPEVDYGIDESELMFEMSEEEPVEYDSPTESETESDSEIDSDDEY